MGATLYIVTLAEAKTLLGIGDTADDTALTLAMENLQGRFDLRCRRRFLYSASETEYFDGGNLSFAVRRWPIITVTALYFDNDRAWDATTLLDEDEYRVDNARGRVWYATGVTKWPAGVRAIKIVFAGGLLKSDTTAASAYTEEEERQALRRAFAQQLCYEWRNKENLGLSGVSARSGSVSLGQSAGALLPEVEAALDPLTRV